MTEVVLSLIAGLVLFLFAISNLSETLQHALGDRARHWISITLRKPSLDWVGRG